MSQDGVSPTSTLSSEPNTLESSLPCFNSLRINLMATLCGEAEPNKADAAATIVSARSRVPNQVSFTECSADVSRECRSRSSTRDPDHSATCSSAPAHPVLRLSSMPFNCQLQPKRPSSDGVSAPAACSAADICQADWCCHRQVQHGAVTHD